MKRDCIGAFRRSVSFMMTACLAAGLVLTGDWTVPASAEARFAAAGPRGAAVGGPRGVAATGPRGSVVSTPRGTVGVGARGGAVVSGPRGAAVRGPAGNVVAAPRGAVPPPGVYGPGRYPPPVYGRPGYPVPVPVPVPVAPAYYGPSGSGVAAGVALGAMLTILPATAIAISNSSGQKVYKADTKCYREIHQSGTVMYEPIPCP